MYCAHSLAYWWGPLGVWYISKPVNRACVSLNSLKEVCQCWSCKSKLPHSITYIIFSLAETCHVNDEVKAKQRQTNQLHPGIHFFPKELPLVGFEPTTLCSLGERTTNWATRTPQLAQYFQATSFKPQYFQLIIMKVSWSPLQKQPCMHMLLRVLQCVIRSDGHFLDLLVFQST